VRKLVVRTEEARQFVDVTKSVADAVVRSGVESGACLVFSPHTTAGITLNEHADPAVAEDMLDAFASAVPGDRAWRHLEGNSRAHVLASLVGSSVTAPVEDGRLALGSWQGIFLCEFDGPRAREVWISLLGVGRERSAGR
jgi:secondary thiamine-phosphate synthase enzyme